MSAGQPVFVLNEDAERTQGRDAQSSNIDAGKAVAGAVRTTLGPNGMDKMLVSAEGDVVVTNDGATILETMDIDHPAATMLVQVAQEQEDEVGDGTTTAAVLTGELLSELEDFLEQDVHPTTVVEGWAAARDVALQAIEDVTLDGELDDELLQRVAATSMTGKGTGKATADQLAESVVKAVRKATTEKGVKRDNIEIVTETGQSSTATSVFNGIVLEEEPVRDDVPKRFEDATIGLIDGSLDHAESSTDVELNIDTADQYAAAVAAENGRLREQAQAVIDAGVDVVFVADDVNEEVADILSNAGVASYEKLSDDQVRSVSRATGARTIHAPSELDETTTGTATITLGKHPDLRGDYKETVTMIESDNAQTVTLYVRAGTEQVLEELERAVGDGVDAVATALSKGGVVPGAGATELAIAKALRESAAGIEGRQQLAVEAFADAVEAIPRTLAANAGLDAIDTLVDLRAAGDRGETVGIVGEGLNAAIVDPVEAGVVDPAGVKRGAISSAVEAATMLARIDDVISAD